jgi:hypothetical protein
MKLKKLTETNKKLKGNKLTLKNDLRILMPTFSYL